MSPRRGTERAEIDAINSASTSPCENQWAVITQNTIQDEQEKGFGTCHPL